MGVSNVVSAHSLEWRESVRREETAAHIYWASPCLDSLSLTKVPNLRCFLIQDHCLDVRINEQVNANAHLGPTAGRRTSTAPTQWPGTRDCRGATRCATEWQCPTTEGSRDDVSAEHASSPDYSYSSKYRSLHSSHTLGTVAKWRDCGFQALVESATKTRLRSACFTIVQTDSPNETQIIISLDWRQFSPFSLLYQIQHPSSWGHHLHPRPEKIRLVFSKKCVRERVPLPCPCPCCPAHLLLQSAQRHRAVIETSMKAPDSREKGDSQRLTFSCDPFDSWESCMEMWTVRLKRRRTPFVSGAPTSAPFFISFAPRFVCKRSFSYVRFG